MSSYSTFRHPKHDEITAMLRNGVPASVTARLTASGLRAVYRVRDIENIPSTPPQRVSVDEKIENGCLPADHEGHVFWIGRAAGSSRTPNIRTPEGTVPVARIMFERRTGRSPVGVVQSDCGELHCVAMSHVSDEIERREVRLQLRRLRGLPDPWKLCPSAGHPFAESGRIGTDLKVYCVICHNDRTARNRRVRNGKEPS